MPKAFYHTLIQNLIDLTTLVKIPMNLMRKIYLTTSIMLALGLFACKKDEKQSIQQTLNFGAQTVINVQNKIGLDTSAVITIGTYDQISLKNLSDNASDFRWDLGDGTTSKEESPLLSYPKSGEYNVTLTATAANGQLIQRSKKFMVLDRVLKQVKITRLNFNSNFDKSPNWPDQKIANVEAVIKKIDADKFPAFANNDYLGEIIYQSAPKALKSNLSETVEIPVVEKIVVDLNMLRNGKYGINLYASDSQNKYILTSSWGSGVGFSYDGNIISRNFVVKSGFIGNSIELVCVFE